MTRQWSRAHDAHIARVCEGLESVAWGQVPPEVQILYIRNHGKKHINAPMVVSEFGYCQPLPYHYNTDLLAGFRALEAWRGKNEEKYSRGGRIILPNSFLGTTGWVHLYEIDRTRGINLGPRNFSHEWANLADLPQAIGWALYDASGGPQ